MFLFGQLSLNNVRKLLLTLSKRRTESENPCVLCLEIVGTIDSYDDVCSFLYLSWFVFFKEFCKVHINFERPHDLLLLLGYIYKGQQEGLIAIADELWKLKAWQK
jgi:hypothetical protein